MDRRWLPFWAALAVLLAALAVALPVQHRIGEELQNQKKLQLLADRVDALDAREKTFQRNLARWYNLNLTLENPEPGFQRAYGSILDFGAGMMGSLAVLEMELCLPIFHGSAGNVGHDPDSALPIGGGGNHTVLYIRGSVFEHLPEPGTVVSVVCLGENLTYRVDSVQVMAAGWPVAREDTGEDLMTLVLDSWTGLSATRTLIRCSRTNTLQIHAEEEGGILKRAMLAALLTMALPVAACIPGLTLRTSSGMRSRASMGVAE